MTECDCNLCDMIKHTTWVSLKDEKPKKDGTDYLGFEDGECYIFNFRMGDWYQCSRSEVGYEVKPTHWMPLPNPPKE